jgi:hypothetical protein
MGEPGQLTWCNGLVPSRDKSLLSYLSRPGLQPVYSPVQGVPLALLPVLKRPNREAGVKVKDERSCPADALYVLTCIGTNLTISAFLLLRYFILNSLSNKLYVYQTGCIVVYHVLYEVTPQCRVTEKSTTASVQPSILFYKISYVTKFGLSNK